MKALLSRTTLCLPFICLNLLSIARADTVQVTTPFTEQACCGELDGTLVVTFNVSNLPVIYNPNTTDTSVPITDVSSAVTFNNGTTSSSSGGSGAITTFGPDYDQLTFNTGDLSGIFVVASNYTGTEDILAGGPFVGSSFLRIGNRDNDVDGGTSTVLPEPSMLSLAVLGFLGLGFTRLRFGGSKA